VHAYSFPPIATAESRVLILGSMPGKVSLQAGEYYAHPRNLFWEFVARCVGLDREAPYHVRVAALQGRGVALWDVLKSCTRTSSLDSDILKSSVVVNEFGAFLDSHPHIKSVYFNGAKAEALFTRHVLAGLPTNRGLSYTRLPSTSPANASIPFGTKVREWSLALGAV
jgi:double-stranded uracil-DNA glycosylase